MNDQIANALYILGTGLPLLLLQYATALVLLAGSVVAYTALTPLRELSLVKDGNVAGGIVLAGTILALALPMAALLATSFTVIDIALWGIVALLLQLVTVGIVSGVLRGLRARIEAGNVAAALVLSASQIAMGLLNAGAMVPN